MSELPVPGAKEYYMALEGYLRRHPETWMKNLPQRRLLLR